MTPRALFQTYQNTLVNMPVNHVWNGHGSAVFLEIGELNYPEKSGKLKNNPDGEYTIMIDGIGV